MMKLYRTGMYFEQRFVGSVGSAHAMHWNTKLIIDIGERGCH